MLSKKSTFIKAFSFSCLFVFGSSLFTSCMTSARQEELQNSVDHLENQIEKLQSQITTKDQQIKNSTQTSIAFQNEYQNLRDQLQLTQGGVDEMRNRIKKLEETAGAPVIPKTTVTTDNYAAPIAKLQKQVARLELLTNANLNYPRKGKLPPKIKNLTDLNADLKTNFDNGNFKHVVDTTTAVLLSHDATDQMLAAALEFRGEARFQLQDYKGAASDLAGVTQLYPNAPRKARALLLAGDSYVYLKNNSIAYLYYQDCSKNYASTAEGKAATARLLTLTAQMNTAPSAQN